MATTAESYLREMLSRRGGAREAVTEPAAPLPFRPEVFFIGRTEGAGVACDPFGRIVRRCKITTEGARAGAAAIQLEEVFAYDDGEVDTWRWAIRPSFDGRYLAAEAKAGAGIAGYRRGDDYAISFRRPLGRLAGVFAPHFSARFSMIASDLAIKRARLSLFGVPLGSLTAFHRHV